MAASLKPPVGGSLWSGMEGWRSSISTRARNGLRSGSKGAQISQAAAVRADTPVSRTQQGRDAVGVGRHQVGGPEPDGEPQLAGVQEIVPARPTEVVPAPPIRRHSTAGVCFSAQRPSLFMAARGTDEAAPASVDPFRSARRRRRHPRPGTSGRRGGCRGVHVVAPVGRNDTLEHSTRSPALTSLPQHLIATGAMCISGISD